MYEFLAALPAVLGVTGFTVFHLLRKQQKGDDISREIVAKLRNRQPDQEQGDYSGLSPRQLERRIANDQEAIRLLDEQDFTLLGQLLRQQFLRGVLVDSVAAALVIVSIVLFIAGREGDAEPTPELRISGIEIVAPNERAGGLLVDLDDIAVIWRASGAGEDVFVALEGLESGTKTEGKRVSSAQERLVFAPDSYRALLTNRERGEANRVRAIIRTAHRKYRSREFAVHVGIKITIAGAPDTIKVMARIDNRPIDFYDFDAKVVIPKKGTLGFLTLDGFDYGHNDHPIEAPDELSWSDIRLAYFGPDDPRLVRPEFIGLARGGR